MTRLSNKQYQWQTMLTMTAYVALLLLVWPLARTVHSFGFKLLLALTPVLPMLFQFVLMARRIRDSDELEQRLHLLALGVASMVIGILSLVGGFLAASHVLSLDGSILILVFPMMLASYGVARAVFVRRYGGDMLACEGGPGIPLYVRALLVAALMAGIAVFAYLRRDDTAWGIFLGMACGFLVVGLVHLIRHQRRGRFMQESGQ